MSKLKLAVTMASGAAAAALISVPANAKDGIRTSTEGITFEAADSNFKLTVGGRLHLDAARWDSDGNDEFEADFRRARIELSGRIAKIVRFRIDREFTNGGGWRNLWVGIEPIDNLEVRGGNVIVPFSMEEAQSSNRSALMERSHVTALAPGFSLGGMVAYKAKNFTASAGYFGDAISREDERGTERGKGFAGRITFAPYRDKKGFAHLAAAVEQRDLKNDDELQFTAKAGSQLVPSLLTTGDIIDGTKLRNLGAEAAFSRGPVLVQGQFARMHVNREILDDLTFNAWYAQASFLLTGEDYDYSRSTGTVSGVDLRRRGNAIELAARVSGIDLDHGSVSGGTGKTYTIGANYYFRRNVRLMVNYAHSEGKKIGTFDEDRDVDVIAGRFQVAF